MERGWCIGKMFKRFDIGDFFEFYFFNYECSGSGGGGLDYSFFFLGSI